MDFTPTRSRPVGHSLACRATLERNPGDGRHRLFLVLPLFAVVALAGIWHGQATSEAPVSAAIITQDAQGQVEVGASQLRTGSYTVAGTSLIQVAAADLRLQGWNGAFHSDISENGAVSIAALTTPVLISRAEAQWLVPVGMQLTIQPGQSDDSLSAWVKTRRPLRLPPHYLREYLPVAERLHSDAPLLPTVTHEEKTFSALAGTALRFTVARQVAELRANADSIAAVKAALQSGNQDRFDALMSQEAVQNAFSQADSRDLLDILSLAVSQDRVPVILPYALNSADAAIVARYHPLLQDKAWVLPSPAMSDRMRLLELSLLPLSDRSDHVTPPLAIRGWADEWVLLRDGVTPDVSTVLLPLLEQDIKRLHTDGYPARSSAYAAALLHVAPTAMSSSREFLRNEDMAILLRPVEASSSSTASVASSSASSSAPVRIWSVAEVQAELRAAGFMFTSQSALEPKESGFRVANVVLATPSGDQSLHFSFNPDAGTVSDISDNGTILPYSLPLERYMAWVRGE